MAGKTDIRKTDEGLFLQSFTGKKVALPPVWLMRQAGRYLPEYRALRTKAKNFLEFCLTPELAIEATLQPIRRFDFDAAIIFADILVIPHALGIAVSFVENEGPRLEAIKPGDVMRLCVDDVAAKLAPILETIKGARAALPNDTALIGFAGAPWTVATYMIEGRGGSDHAVSRIFAAAHEAAFDRLMDVLVAATSDYLIAQARAGANALQIFDSWAASVPASLRERAIFQPTARIVANVKASFPHVPIIGFPRGIGLDLARYVARTGVDGVSLDQSVDVATARKAVGDTIVLQGNLDPVLLADAPDAAMASAAQITQAAQGSRFVFNLGHGILPHTPIAHVERLLETLRGKRAREDAA